MNTHCPTCGCNLYKEIGPCRGQDALELLQEIAAEARFEPELPGVRNSRFTISKELFAKLLHTIKEAT